MTATSPRPTCPAEVNVTDHIPLLWEIMRRHGYDRPRVRGSLDPEDLIQVGVIGLMRAKEQWDPARGSWTTVAWQWARHFMNRTIEDHSVTVRTPVHVQTKRRQAGEHTRADVLSLDRGRDADGGDTFLEQLTYTEPEDEHDATPRTTIERLLASTPELREKEVHVLRGRAQGKLLDQIGAELGLSRERIRQLEVIAVAKVRGGLGVEADDRIAQSYARLRRSKAA